MGNFAENLNLGNRVRPPLHLQLCFSQFDTKFVTKQPLIQDRNHFRRVEDRKKYTLREKRPNTTKTQ